MMKSFGKILKKTLAFVTSAILMISLASCGGGGENSGNNGGTGEGGELKISVARLGYGIEWLNQIAKEFEKETKVKVRIVSKVGMVGVDAIKTEIDSKSSDTDLVFNHELSFGRKVYEGAITVKGKTYDCLYEDLSDVYESVVDEGTTKTIKDKVDKNFANSYMVNGKYYGLPWAGGVMGFARNVDVWNYLELTDEDVPLTTDQLWTLCDKIKARKAPFIFCMEDNYVEGVLPLWMAQYEGVESYSQFMEGKDPDGNITEYIFSYDGAKEMIKIAQKWFAKSNGYQHSKSNAVDFTQMQGLFLKDEALFCVNGTWLESEMSSLGVDTVVDYIKTPVISSIINKLDTINSDAQLAEIIKYVDAVDAGDSGAVRPEYVSDDDLKAVTEARHYAFISDAASHQAYIPSYAKNKTQAKAFLKYMFSDKGLNIYYRTLKGATLPAETVNGYDSSITPSSFLQSSNKAFEEKHVLSTNTTNRYFIFTGIVWSGTPSYGYMLRSFYNETATVDQMYNTVNSSAKAKFDSAKDKILA